MYTLATFAENKGLNVSELDPKSNEFKSLVAEFDAHIAKQFNDIKDVQKAQGLAMTKAAKSPVSIAEKNPVLDVNLDTPEFKEAIKNLKDTRVSKNISVAANLVTGLTYSPTRNIVITPETVNTPLTANISWTLFNDPSFKWLSRSENLNGEAVADSGAGAVPTETDFTLTVKNVETVKIKSVARIDEVMLSDVAIASSQLENVMKRAIAAKVEQQLILGTGTGSESNSLESRGTAFDGSDAAYAAKIQAPNMVDVLLAAASEIGGASAGVYAEKSFKANMALVSASDYFVLVQSLKDTQNNYVQYNQAKDMQGSVSIGGLTILPSSFVASDKAYVLDTTVVNGVMSNDNRTLQMGYTDAGFEQDIVSAKLINRINLVVDDNDVRGVQKIDSISTAITNMTKA